MCAACTMQVRDACRWIRACVRSASQRAALVHDDDIKYATHKCVQRVSRRACVTGSLRSASHPKNAPSLCHGSGVLRAAGRWDQRWDQQWDQRWDQRWDQP